MASTVKAKQLGLRVPAGLLMLFGGALGDSTDWGGRDRSAVVGIGQGTSEWAGYFEGDVKATGELALDI